MEELVCETCGHHNPADSNFCSVCGGSLERTDASQTASHEIGDDGEGQPMLVVVRGNNAGSRYLLSGSVVTIGRHPDSDVFLDDVTVSRRHAEVRSSPMTGLEVADVGSLNGTYVNGERIERSELSEGDQLQIGKYRLVVVADDDDVAGDGDQESDGD